jgi:hypothetical protein
MLRDCRVAMLTFGGKQFMTFEKGKVLHASQIVEKNDSYTVIQNGLNFYVFETPAIEIKDDDT